MYKPIPKDAKLVYLGMFGCGPECCDAVYVYIRSDKVVLWESDSLYFSLDGSYKEELEQLRKDTIAACEYYGIIPIDIDDDCVYDWEGERRL